MLPLSREDNPRRLLHFFLLFSLTSFVAILISSYLGIRHIYTTHMMQEAQNDSVNIGRLLFDHEGPALKMLSQQQKTNQEDQEFIRLDNNITRHLKPFDIVKIKVFSKDARIIYSTDKKIIDERDLENDSLPKAYQGQVVSEIVKKNSFVDLSDETRFDIDVVETYIPLEKDGIVVGAFELYRDVTPYREGLTSILRSSMIMIGSFLLVTFILLYWLMRIGVCRILGYEKELHEMAVHDSLTGLLNRRALLSQGDMEFNRMLRIQSFHQKNSGICESLSCIMLDIDHFKKVNDQFGHAAGDEVLKELAARVKRSVRSYDVVGRYGGEEFIIVMPHTSPAEAKVIADRVWSVIRNTPFKINKHHIKVTISLGLATLTQQDEMLEDVITRSDKRLYKAKQAGRDQIVWE